MARTCSQALANNSTVETMLNQYLLEMAKQELAKHAFVDPATAAGGGMDPSMGGMPPGDPSAMGGMPPGGGDPLAGLQPMIQQAVQQAMAAQGGGAAGGGAGGGLKPKIDVNVALMQMSKMLARICSTLGIVIPPEEMIATPQDLGAMAQQQATGAGGSGGQAGGAPAGPSPTVQPIGGIPAALPPGGGAPAGGGQKAAEWDQFSQRLAGMAEHAAAIRMAG